MKILGVNKYPWKDGIRLWIEVALLLWVCLYVLRGYRNGIG